MAVTFGARVNEDNLRLNRAAISVAAATSVEIRPGLLSMIHLQLAWVRHIEFTSGMTFNRNRAVRLCRWQLSQFGKSRLE
jgi:hypothetical protein